MAVELMCNGHIRCEIHIQKIFADAQRFQHFSCNLLQFVSIPIDVINVRIMTFLCSKFQQNCNS